MDPPGSTDGQVRIDSQRALRWARKSPPIKSTTWLEIPCSISLPNDVLLHSPRETKGKARQGTVRKGWGGTVCNLSDSSNQYDMK